MPNWTDYTQKQQPSDNDLMMIEDVDANVNKRLEFSGLADWMVEKLKKNNVISGALKFKGSSAYASLPTNPEQNDYYYSPDGNGTDGAGYYAWNGTAWIFIGNNDKGVDSTFTVEGAAADSKAVGDKFAKVDSETASLKEDISNKITKFYASNQGEARITDSDNGKIQDMMLYGKSSQDGTPSPENPVEIKSVVNPTVKVSNEDGTQFKTVTLPYTLNAIPVSSGGNVTIDGQQYIADYVDVERGKLVRMVGEFVQNNQEWRIEKSNPNYAVFSSKTTMSNMRQNDNIVNYCSNYFKCISTNNRYSVNTLFINSGYILVATMPLGTTFDDFLILIEGKLKVFYQLETPTEIDLTPEEVQALKALTTYYPTTNISVNSEQLDGYTVFNYPISMANGWNYVKKQLNDNRDYIYDMDLQSAEAYVNSEYAVALTELEV